MKLQRQPSQLITFLENQNKSLREQNKSCMQLLQLNRKALKIALGPRQNEQSLPPLVSLLFEENSKILSRIAILREQLEKKSCEALISQQIASASNQHEKYVASELKDRLRILRKEIQSKDKFISELQKQLKKENLSQAQIQAVTGLIEYTDTTKISQKLFKQAEYLRRELDLQSQEVSKYRQQKEQLIKLNLILTKQVNELKAYSCQTTTSQKRDFNTSSTDLSKFLKYQAKIAENSGDQSNEDQNDFSSDEHGEDDEEEYMEEEPQYIIKKQPPKLTLSLKKQEESILKQEKPSKVTMPKLQLKKAKEIQNLIIKKINNDEKKKANVGVKDEKFKKLETEIEQIRKKLGNEIIIKMKFERQNNFLKKFINELQQRNDLLLRERQDENIEKDYERVRELNKEQNLQTLLDICRDVTLNERLRSVIKGKDQLIQKRDIYSKQI